MHSKRVKSALDLHVRFTVCSLLTQHMYILCLLATKLILPGALNMYRYSLVAACSVFAGV